MVEEEGLGGFVAWWLGDLAAWWLGGLVAGWHGGLVGGWLGGLATWWLDGLVEGMTRLIMSFFRPYLKNTMETFVIPM